MFDAATRAGVAASTIGFGDALAGRGGDINNAIGAFVPLVTDLGPVARNLASKQTDLAGFFRGLETFSSALVPVAQTQATLYENLDTTFRALASVAVPFLQDWISRDAADVQHGDRRQPDEPAFLTDTAGLFAELRPAFETLTPERARARRRVRDGTRNLPGTYQAPDSLDTC